MMKSSAKHFCICILTTLFACYTLQVTGQAQDTTVGNSKTVSTGITAQANITKAIDTSTPEATISSINTTIPPDTTTTASPITTPTKSVDPNTTSTVAPINTTTVAPINTTTVAPITTTTSAPNTTTTFAPNTTTTVAPITTTTVAPNSTTTASPNTTTTVTPTTSTTQAPPTPCNHHFDGPSFIGGIVLTVGLLAIGLVAYKFYKARYERNYHTL